MTAHPAIAHFVGFGALLRANGFAVAQEQTQSLIAAMSVMPLRDLGDVQRAARATLAPPPDRRPEFDALFAAHFAGASLPAAIPAEAEDDVAIQQEDDGFDVDFDDAPEPSGQEATSAETLTARDFAPTAPDAALRAFARVAPARLPRRIGRRRRRAPTGRVDLRRSLRDALKRDGEVFRFPRDRRRLRQRPILLLIDVSGSMKERTDAHLRFAHTLTRAADRVETFTFGTRLTRVTPAMRLRSVDRALCAAAETVADFDGGTRIGDALGAFLALPRFAARARGALAVVLSDGLERGEPDAMAVAVARLSRRSWRLLWLSPLGGPDAPPPLTTALDIAAPFIDEFADGASVAALCGHLLFQSDAP